MLLASARANNPLLEFDNIWVHSQCALDTHSANIAHNTTQIKSKSDNQLNNKQILINAANGQLLQGQLTVLTGHSGSGKSVLLRVLAGLSPLNTGSIWLHDDNGRLNIQDTTTTQWRRQVALLAQHPELVEGTVLDNLQLPYSLQAHRRSHFNTDWHIQQLALLNRRETFLQQSAAHLSGGERQLVNTLRLLQLKPQVLLLDEPTAALDTETASHLIQLLISWLQAEPQRALLWVTHDTQAIMPVAHKHWKMEAGILTDVTINKVLNSV